MSSPTTTSAGGSPPGCGGCSTTSGTRTAPPSSTAATRPGSPRAVRSRPRCPTTRRRSCDLAEAWTNTIDRARLDRAARRGRPARRPGRTRYRGETEPIDPRARPHPDRRSARPPTATSGRTGACSIPPRWPSGSARSGPTARPARSSRRAAAASRPASTAWPCGSPACRTRSSIPARTATGAGPGCPWRSAPEPGRRARVAGPDAPGPVSPATQVFRGLALLYLVTNARYGSGSGSAAPAAGDDSSRARGRDCASWSACRRRSDAWSDGLVTLEPLDIVEVRRPLASLSSSGEGRWWAGPRDCREELLEHVADHRYDSRVRPVAGGPGRAAVRLGLHGRAVRGHLRGRFHARSRPTTGRPSRPTPIPSRATSTNGSTRSSRSIANLGLGEDELPNLHAAGDFTSTRPVSRAAIRRVLCRVPRRDGRQRRRAGPPWPPGRRRSDLGTLVPRLDDRSAAPARRAGRAGRSTPGAHPGTLEASPVIVE